MKKISKDELKKVLEQHELWVRTDGRDGVHANLSYADLRRFDLQVCLEDVDLKCTDLREANLQGVDLNSANLRGADLQAANLSDTNLMYADLREANLYEVNLRGSNLEKANISRANLFYTDLCGAKFDSGVLECYTLEKTIWLKSDIPWYLYHPDYVEWGDTIQILDE